MLTDEISEYLSAGGLFNPELMDHDAVRDLLMKCRKELDRLRKKCDTQANILRRLTPEAHLDTLFIHMLLGKRDENNMPEQLAVVPGAKTDENQ